MASSKVIDSANINAEYSPSEWPAITLGSGKDKFLYASEKMADDKTRSGWVKEVKFNLDSSP